MNLEEFEDLVDRCGEDIDRWPATSREQAAELLRRNEAAREIVNRATFLRRVVATTPRVRAPAGLVDRITSAATQQSRLRLETQNPIHDWWSMIASDPLVLRPVVLLALCFVVGAGAGLLFFPIQGNADQVDFPTLLARVIN